MRLSRCLLLASCSLIACSYKPSRPPNPCDPNPCRDANKTTCVVESEKARCLCDPHFVLRPSGVCEELSLSNCPEHGGDTAEPDDCIARARPMLTTEAPRSQSIEPLGDYDFYKFTASNRHVYTISVAAQGSLSPRIDIFDQAGVWLDAMDQVSTSTLSYKARYAGQHYFRVTHSPFDPSVATGSYTLTFSSSGAEDHGDGPQEATAVSAFAFDPNATPPSTSGRFETAGDQDWFSFDANAGTNYSVAFNPQRLVPVMSLYASSDTTTPIWTNQQETNPFNVQSSGTYYLVMYPPQSSTSTSGYEFQFTRAN